MVKSEFYRDIKYFLLFNNFFQLRNIRISIFIQIIVRYTETETVDKQE